MMGLTKVLSVTSLLLFSSTSFAVVCQTNMVGPRGGVLQTFQGRGPTEFEACKKARMLCSLELRTSQREVRVVTPRPGVRVRPGARGGRVVGQPSELRSCELVGVIGNRPHPRPGHQDPRPIPGGYSRWDRELNQIENMLQGGQSQSRVYAVRELERYPAPRALMIAVKTLADNSYNVRVAASNAVRSLLNSIDLAGEGMQVAELITPLLKGANSEVRTNAVKILGKLDLAFVLADVVKTVGDNSYNVRVAASNALNSLLGKGLAQFLRGPMLREMENLALRGSTSEVRVSAIKVLGETGNPNVRKTLIQATSDNSYNVRVAAQNALRKI